MNNNTTRKYDKAFLMLSVPLFLALIFKNEIPDVFMAWGICGMVLTFTIWFCYNLTQERIRANHKFQVGSKVLLKGEIYTIRRLISDWNDPPRPCYRLSLFPLVEAEESELEQV